MYVATRDAMLKHTGLKDPWSALKALEVSAVELAVDRALKTDGFHGAEGGKPFELSAEPGRRALAERAKKEGVRVCALLMANDFSNEDLEAEVKWGVAAVRAAKELGAPAVRVDFVPHTRKDIDLGVFAERCVQGARRILDETKDTHVALGVENHGKVSNRPDFLDRIFDGVGSERMGLTLDSGNFYWFGHPIDEVYKIMERYAARARHTHVKNINYPAETRSKPREIGWRYGDFVCPLDQGDIDHSRVVRILKKAGYDGAITLEDESLGKAAEKDRVAVLKRDVAHLKGCVK